MGKFLDDVQDSNTLNPINIIIEFFIILCKHNCKYY